MENLRSGWRLLRIAEHILTGALISLVFAGWLRLGFKLSFQPRVVCWWHRRLCRILHLRIKVLGRQPTQAGLLISNHISWLDIPVIGSLQYPLAFLSKAEVRAWPLVGWMSALAGTLFIERGAGQSAVIVETIGSRLAGDGSVLFFPEGTTSDGSSVLRFHPRLFAIAQQTRAPLHPVGLRYSPAPGQKNVAPFIGDDELMPHMLRVLRQPFLEVEVHYLPTRQFRGEDRKTLANNCREAIQESLGLCSE